QVTLDGTQHAKLVDDVAAKVYGLIEPRLMAMAKYIVGAVSATKPAATPPDPTPIRRSKKAPSKSSRSKKHREIPSPSPSSTDPSSSSSDAETPSPPKKHKRGRPRKQTVATDINQQAVPPAAAHRLPLTPCKRLPTRTTARPPAFMQHPANHPRQRRVSYPKTPAAG
ncbi:unnamed protein product, partial [Ectocarpus sp. 6 AP-2014]